MDWKWHYVTSASEWVQVAQSCPTLCDPMDYTVHGILQARILEWAAYSISRGSSRPRNQTRVSCIAGGFFTSWDTREALKWLLKVDHNMPQGHLPAHWITNFQSSAPQWKKWFSHFLNLLGGGPSHRKRLTIHSDPNFWLLSAYPPNTWIKEFRPEQSFLFTFRSKPHWDHQIHTELNC